MVITVILDAALEKTLHIPGLALGASCRAERSCLQPGGQGLTAAAALAIASMVFSVLMGNSTRYSLIYGSLASVIIMLVWLYLCGNILIMGNVINYVLFTHRKEARR